MVTITTVCAYLCLPVQELLRLVLRALGLALVLELVWDTPTANMSSTILLKSKALEHAFGMLSRFACLLCLETGSMVQIWSTERLF